MIVVSGSPMAYRREWRHELQQLLRIQDLNSSIDAVILGHVEPCHGGYVSRQQQQAVVQNNGTTQQQQQQQDHDTCQAYPSITEWMQVYAGPMVFVSGFSNHFDRQALAVRHEMGRVLAKQPQRTNLAWLWGRQYMTRYDLDECAASGGKVTVADCRNNSIRNGQRCTGANGGHADVLAWDVSEFLHYYLMERDNDDDKEQTDVEYFRVPVDPRLQHVNEDERLVHDDFVWCPANQQLQVPGLEVDIVRIFYQCQGPLYDQYTQDLRHKLFTDTIKSHTTASWGKRHFALLHHARILVWGNSHTRQVLKALACQQNTLGHLVGIEPLDNIYGGIMYYFSNNATIVSLCNSVAPYSRNWLQFLEQGLNMKLKEFDALVLGFFNYCRGSNRVKIEAAAGNNSDIDCSPSNPPPTVVDIAQVYKGPIVFTTMFDSSRYRDTPDYLQQVQELRKKGRSNVYAVHARQYAQDWGIECLSPSRETVHDCGERVIVGNNTEALSTGHACMGPAGGTADLVAWDVTELLFEQLS